MSENVKNIENVSKDWKLTKDERRALYKICAKALDEGNQM
jgi:hypothetical protein